MSQVPYGPSDPTPPAIAVIDGRGGRRWTNALTLSLVEAGPEGGRALGTAQQGRGAKFRTKLAIALGFKNYAPAITTLTLAEGSALVLRTRSREPTPVLRGDGSAVATITRGETTLATTPDGRPLLHFVPDPVEAKTDGRYRTHVLDTEDALVATLDLVRIASGWSGADLVGGLLDVLDDLSGPVQSSANSLPTLFLGTRLLLMREPTPLEREVLLAACVEQGVLARAYWPGMGQESAYG